MLLRELWASWRMQGIWTGKWLKRQGKSCDLTAVISWNMMTRTFYRQYSVFKVQTSYEASLCHRAFGDLIILFLKISLSRLSRRPAQILVGGPALVSFCAFARVRLYLSDSSGFLRSRLDLNSLYDLVVIRTVVVSAVLCLSIISSTTTGIENTHCWAKGVQYH